MVTIPEALAVGQLEGIFRELDRYGLTVSEIIINNVVKIEDSLFLQTKARQQRPYLKHLHEKYGKYKITELPMFPQEVKGLERLQQVSKILFNA
jgi:arsenite-transporting ATPase